MRSLPRSLLSLSITLSALAIPSCGGDPPRAECVSSAQCAAGRACVDERCVLPTDAGPRDGG
ncbi:MAG: hypothetical protein M3Y87_03200, partial [Myxococcota bacterium]|nr:hypothetical protein [Myxococcota bacterium]